MIIPGIPICTFLGRDVGGRDRSCIGSDCAAFERHPSSVVVTPHGSFRGGSCSRTWRHYGHTPDVCEPVPKPTLPVPKPRLPAHDATPPAWTLP